MIQTRTRETWRTVYFEAQENEDIEVLELNVHNEYYTFDITSAHEEGVSFKNITLKQAELRLKALEKAIDYLKELNSKQHGS